jgi:transmembrane sensor
MTMKMRTDVSEKLDAETVALLSALEAGELDGAARAEAEALVARSPAARATLERLSRLRALTAAAPNPALEPATRRRIRETVWARLASGRRRRRAWGAVAVAAMLAVAGLLWLLGSPAPQTPSAPKDVAADEVRTGAGEHRLVQIGKRATAFVGERSVVRVLRPGTDANATGAPLYVVVGRVRLVVRPDRENPFTVATEAADAVVYGTEFDVDVRDGETEVRVARGEVEVRNALGARRLWAGEVARAQVGNAPRRFERIEPILLDGPAEIQRR